MVDGMAEVLLTHILYVLFKYIILLKNLNEYSKQKKDDDITDVVLTPDVATCAPVFCMIASRGD